MKKRRGFTLIELLVVAAIIALLIAILLPSLTRARKQARTLVCETNERSLVNALRTYVSDWNTTLLSGGHGGIYGAWDYQILGANVTQSSYYANNARRDATDKLRWCPETTTPRRPGPAVGTVLTPWDCRKGSYGGSTGSYGFNNWLYTSTGFVSRSGTVSPGDFYKITRAMQNESTVPVFVDAVWHDFIPRITDVPGTNLEDPEGSTSADRTLADVALDRHNRAVNVSFMDDHVETVQLGMLWTLKWSQTWSRSAPYPVR